MITTEITRQRKQYLTVHAGVKSWRLLSFSFKINFEPFIKSRPKKAIQNLPNCAACDRHKNRRSDVDVSRNWATFSAHEFSKMLNIKYILKCDQVFQIKRKIFMSEKHLMGRSFPIRRKGYEWIHNTSLHALNWSKHSAKFIYIFYALEIS